ncbi:MAG: cytochrome P460 [Gammaproteobacteria bacterium]|nr:MAG: cytochrome P460 [Gammaproteobacteria bacterium]
MMKTVRLLILALFAFSNASIAGTPEPSNGIAYPQGWQDWATIAVSHRTDNQTLRVIIGNDIAVQAARSGDTRPWPDGAIIGKVVWKDGALDHWPTAVVPAQFVHAEFMIKDAQQFPDSGGWGWARWVGDGQTAFNEGNGACMACHTPVKANDWVFTKPAMLPATAPKPEHIP